MKEIIGTYSGESAKFSIVVSRFNDAITSKLVDGAILGLKQQNVNTDNIEVVWVPGAFEIPLVAKRLVETRKPDAVICLGAVIKGATSHFDYVCAQSASGILQTSLQSNIPIIYGILTCDTIEQAQERSGIKHKNKGYEAAFAAVEMVSVLKQL